MFKLPPMKCAQLAYSWLSIMADFIVEEHVMACAWALAYKNNEESRRVFQAEYGKEPPSRKIIAHWKSKLVEAESLED